MQYRVHSLILETNVPLPGLQPEALKRQPDVVYWHAQNGQAHPSALRLGDPDLRIRMASGEQFLEYWSTGSGYNLRFQNQWDFWISNDGSKVTGSAPSSAPMEYLRLFLVEWVFTLIIELKGLAGLHASAVALDGIALAFAGVEGAGKSTLVASLARSGFPLVTDDVLAIKLAPDGCRVAVHQPEVRLFPATVDALMGADAAVQTLRVRFDKLVIRLPGVEGVTSDDRSLPLGAIYLLREEGADTVTIERIPAKAVAPELFRHSFAVPQRDPKLAMQQFRRLCHVAERVPVYRLAYPRRLDSLPDVAAALRAEHGSQAPAFAGDRGGL